MSFNKILIAVDSSEYSIAAAKKGLELAHILNAQVALIFVVDSSKAIGNAPIPFRTERHLFVKI